MRGSWVRKALTPASPIAMGEGLDGTPASPALGERLDGTPASPAAAGEGLDGR
jgi:hypothetical protein